MSRRLLNLVWALILASVSSVHGQESVETSAHELKSEFKRAEFKPEARVAVAQGIEFLQAKQHKQAINAFLSAARMHPNNGQFRQLLGVAYAKDKQLGAAWLQFRKAVIFNQAYAPSVRGFLRLWTNFDRNGVFTAGRPKEQIEKILGQPDANQEADQQDIWVYGFMRLQFFGGRLFAIVDPRGLDAETIKAVDVMKINFDDKSRWQLGYRAINKLHSVTEYVPKQQSVQDWKELYTVQQFHKMASRSTPKKMMEDIEKNLKKADSKTNFIVLADTENDVLFHWNNKGSKQQPAQHEIVRLVLGQRDIHRLAYTRKVPQIPQAEAQMWLDLLQQAKLTSTAEASTLSN